MFTKNQIIAGAVVAASITSVLAFNGVKSNLPPDDVQNNDAQVVELQAAAHKKDDSNDTLCNYFLALAKGVAKDQNSVKNVSVTMDGQTMQCGPKTP